MPTPVAAGQHVTGSAGLSPGPWTWAGTPRRGQMGLRSPVGTNTTHCPRLGLRALVEGLLLRVFLRWSGQTDIPQQFSSCAVSWMLLTPRVTTASWLTPCSHGAQSLSSERALAGAAEGAAAGHTDRTQRHRLGGHEVQCTGPSPPSASCFLQLPGSTRTWTSSSVTACTVLT